MAVIWWQDNSPVSFSRPGSTTEPYFNVVYKHGKWKVEAADSYGRSKADERTAKRLQTNLRRRLR